MSKKILIVALTEDWIGISRLPAGLKRAGFEVAALCPEKSFLAKTRFLDRTIKYRTYTYTRSKIVYWKILKALTTVEPDLVIPGDEEALLALQNVANLLSGIPFLSKYSQKIRHSLTAQQFDQIALNKSQFVEHCHRWGVSVPRNTRVETIEKALRKVPEFGFPVVLKFDFGYGASGVSICQNETDLRLAFAKHKQAGMVIILKALLKKLFFVVQESRQAGISLQQYISGPVGLAPFCAFEGRLFAANPMLKLKTYPGTTGPSSVCKGIENTQIQRAVLTVVEKMKYTGFGSLDFIIDIATQKVYVIELNPRPVPTSHFDGGLCADDLCVSFFRGLNGMPIEKKSFKPFLISLFPNEKKRDPQSPYLTESFHDIPRNDPELVAALESR